MTSRYQNTVEYITGKSFSFISLKEKLDLTLFSVRTNPSILFLTQSLLFSMVAYNATPAHPAERSHITHSK